MSDDKRTSAPGSTLRNLEEKLLEDSPRLSLDDEFKFGCHPGVSCFNRCCHDVNIFLSPYDVLRLKNRLGMTSTEFLDKYALLPVQKEMKTPVVVLRMNDDETKSCPFLNEDGCSVYADRPWPCRMYPLGMAAQKDTSDGWGGEKFYFLLQEEACKGFGEDTEWTVRQWLDDQGIYEYDRWGDGYKELTLHQFFEREDAALSPEKMHMLFTACYDLDRFREFVFESTLLDRFEIDEEFVEDMRTDDEELLRFGYLWLQFSLFGEKTMRVKPEVAEAFKGSLDKRQVFDKESADEGSRKG